MARPRLDQPWRPQSGIAHIWCGPGPVCEGAVARDCGATEGLLAYFAQRPETCPMCLCVIREFFGRRGVAVALALRKGGELGPVPEWFDPDD